MNRLMIRVLSEQAEDGGQRLIAGKAAHDDGVRGIEEQLQDAGEHDRQGEEDHLREDGALGHVERAM